MDLLIESTREFEQDLATFSTTKKANIIEQMNKTFQIILHDPESLFKTMTLAQLKEIKLNSDYESSLYSLRLKPEIRIILTIDDDPIFDRTLITLFRIVNAEDASIAYSSVAETLYEHFALKNQEIEVH
jgi:hypothetical protein